MSHWTQLFYKRHEICFYLDETWEDFFFFVETSEIRQVFHRILEDFHRAYNNFNISGYTRLLLGDRKHHPPEDLSDKGKETIQLGEI